MKKHPTILVRATWKVLGCGKMVFRWKSVLFWPSRPLKRPFCGTRDEGVVSLMPTFASLVAMKSPRWGKMFFHWKSVLFGLLDLWKGFVVALEVRGWCHSCQLLHHSGLFELTRRPSWCKSWHSWHHPLTSWATTKPFQRSRRPKRTDFQWKNIFPHLGLFIATHDAKVCTRDTTPSALMPQKSLFKGLEGQKELIFSGKPFCLTSDFSRCSNQYSKILFLAFQNYISQSPRLFFHP